MVGSEDEKGGLSANNKGLECHVKMSGCYLRVLSGCEVEQLLYLR